MPDPRAGAERVEFLSAVIITADRPAELAKFYSDVLGVPLEASQHGDSAQDHFECDLGDVHFAIHPRAHVPGRVSGGCSIGVGLAVPDIEKLWTRLHDHGVVVIQKPEDQGFAIMAIVQDPEGNIIHLTQLSTAWLAHLRDRRTAGEDILAKYKPRKPSSKFRRSMLNSKVR